MAAIATSGSLSRASEEAAKRGDAAKAFSEKLRLELASALKALDLERSGVRALKAQYEADVRKLTSEAKKREKNLERQLRDRTVEKCESSPDPGLKRLTAEVQSLKATNRALQESLEAARQSARQSAEQLRASNVERTAREHERDRRARADTHRLLEEIKSKDRVIAQLKKTTPQPSSDDKARRMEYGAGLLQKINLDQGKARGSEEELLDIELRNEEDYFKECLEMDSAVSSAPPSLSPQPQGVADMWGCAQCRTSLERAEERARECGRLADALRDARDQLELLEFRVLELEDAAPDKCAREALTDSDSGFISPSIQVSPVLRRTDSGYKSPAVSPQASRRSHTNEVLSEHLTAMLDRCSLEDRDCLHQVLDLLHDIQALSSADIDIQIQTRELPSRRSLSRDHSEGRGRMSKAIATVSPYSQTRRSTSSLESLGDEPRKVCALQESGIFDEVVTEDRGTQTELGDSLECGDLNTEIQRLNIIREKLERRGVARASPLKEEGLECGCVKLGKKHKQYYERRLKFLEGKISIYEAAQDVKEARLAERLQREYILDNRIQELEALVCCVRERCARLEEECCELEELENDTRLHAQQLETDYELVTAQLRDMSEQRECSRAQAEKLARALEQRSKALEARANKLASTLAQLERAIPAVIAWNVLQALGDQVDKEAQVKAEQKLATAKEQQELVSKIRRERKKKDTCTALVVWRELEPDGGNAEKKLQKLAAEKARVEEESAREIAALKKQMAELRRRLEETAARAQRRCTCVADKMRAIQSAADAQDNTMDAAMCTRIQKLVQSERALTERVRELERRETAYLDMLTQADDMWAEMESGYKRRIEETDAKLSETERQRARLQASCSALRRQLTDAEQSESAARVALERCEREGERARGRAGAGEARANAAEAELAAEREAFAQIANKYKSEMEAFRQKTAKLSEQLESDREASRKTESKLSSDLERTRRELARTCRNVQDLEVTTAELREEVESLETQLALMQKSIAQCRRKCDEKVKTISRELSIKTEELEEMRSDLMRKSLRPSLRSEMRECDDYSIRYDFPTHQSLGYEARCSCPAMRSRLVGSLIEDLFERIHSVKDEDLATLCQGLAGVEDSGTVRGRVTEYLLMTISKELVRSIGDADAKADSQEWRCAAGGAGGAEEGNAGVVSGAARLASVACACAAARLCAARPDLAHAVNICQQEVLENGDVKIMEEQLASAIESILNCPSCALGTNAIVWSTDV